MLLWNLSKNSLQGLEFIHNSGVIHLDLKPANIFVTGGGRFKIGDFGMASLWPRPNYKAVGSFEGGGAFEREGDKLYLAPEVLQGNYGKEADIFRYYLFFGGQYIPILIDLFLNLVWALPCWKQRRISSSLISKLWFETPVSDDLSVIDPPFFFFL